MLLTKSSSYTLCVNVLNKLADALRGQEAQCAEHTSLPGILSFSLHNRSPHYYYTLRMGLQVVRYGSK